MMTGAKLILIFFVCFFNAVISSANPAQSNNKMQPNAALSLMDRDSEDYDHASSASVNYADEVYNKKIREINLKQAEFINKHWRKVFNLQYIMSMIIFIVVIFIVLTGLFLSYKQFEFTHEMLRKHHDAKRAIVSQGPDATSTITNTSADEKTETDISLSGSNTFEISKDGIKINSAVIGLIILAMAIAFFFLYLEFVYPIHQVQI